MSPSAGGLVVFLLSVQVIQSQDGWRVNYRQTDICAVKGSRVYISCIIKHPSGKYPSDIKDRFWFTKEKDGEPVDLTTDSEYSGRVEYDCYTKGCTLIIKDPRKSDSAEYKFTFMTSKSGEKYTGSPGVTLSVKDSGFQVQVRRSDSTWLELTCHSSCVLSDRAEYDWSKNGEIIKRGSSLRVSSGSTDRYSCYLRGSWDNGSPAVYGPWRPSVSVSPSAEMLEGDSLTLTCSTDANPAANYTWYKEAGTSDPRLLSEKPQQIFSSIQSSDSGRYFCTAENQLGRKRSEFISINVKYGPRRPSVSVSPSAEMLEGDSLTLTCSTDANPAANYTWYKEHGTSDPRLVSEKPQLIFSSIQSFDSGRYFCATENRLGRKRSDFILIPVKYGPQRPSVSVSPSAQMVEGDSVNLTCSADANPAANYTWYKEAGTSDPHLLSEEPQLFFSFIRSSDSGLYSCTVENQLGRKTSEFISIDVKYGPWRPFVSVSPSAEMLEGDSVTLTCSTDANPAANYTWYKEAGTSDPRLLSEKPQLIFSSIQSSDSGRYFCTAENQLGRKRSEFISINVKYVPQRPFVSASPSAEMLEGDSVTLTCSTDANPATNYTWYKEHEDSPRASGQIFTITDFRAEHSGNYYCEARNEMGRSNSTSFLMTFSEGRPWSTAAVASTSAILLVIMILAALLLIRKRSSRSFFPGKRPDNIAEQIPLVQLCSVSFSGNQEDLLLYSNIRPARPPRPKEEVEEVLYNSQL
ncbi:B-cell receptor CD22-like isoform X4 [Gasterosteus aculeatus]